MDDNQHRFNRPPGITNLPDVMIHPITINGELAVPNMPAGSFINTGVIVGSPSSRSRQGGTATPTAAYLRPSMGGSPVHRPMTGSPTAQRQMGGSPTAAYLRPSVVGPGNAARIQSTSAGMGASSPRHQTQTLAQTQVQGDVFNSVSQDGSSGVVRNANMTTLNNNNIHNTSTQPTVAIQTGANLNHVTNQPYIATNLNRSDMHSVVHERIYNNEKYALDESVVKAELGVYPTLQQQQQQNQQSSRIQQLSPFFTRAGLKKLFGSTTSQNSTPLFIATILVLVFINMFFAMRIRTISEQRKVTQGDLSTSDLRRLSTADVLRLLRERTQGNLNESIDSLKAKLVDRWNEAPGGNLTSNRSDSTEGLLFENEKDGVKSFHHEAIKAEGVIKQSDNLARDLLRDDWLFKPERILHRGKTVQSVLRERAKHTNFTLGTSSEPIVFKKGVLFGVSVSENIAKLKGKEKHYIFDEYMHEIQVSAESLRKVLTGQHIGIGLVIDVNLSYIYDQQLALFDYIIFNNVTRESEQLYPHGMGWVAKVMVMLHTPFSETLFVDGDTYFCSDPTEIFDLLKFSLISMAKEVRSTDVELSRSSRLNLNAGVIAYRQAMLTAVLMHEIVRVLLNNIEKGDQFFWGMELENFAAFGNLRYSKCLHASISSAVHTISHTASLMVPWCFYTVDVGLSIEILPFIEHANI